MYNFEIRQKKINPKGLDLISKTKSIMKKLIKGENIPE